MAKFPQQVELIHRVKATLNLSDVQLAQEVEIRPETMQKYAAGYQKAGSRLLQLLDRLLAARQRRGAGTTSEPAVAPEISAERRRDVNLDAPLSSQEQLDQVLTQGSIEEVELVRQLLDSVCRQIHARLVPPPSRVLLIDGKHRLVPALGYIPAGHPQEAIQQANQFIPVPEGKFAEADYALKVQGDSMVDADIHHGDWVMMSIRRQPRHGNVVAALCDGEACLKTYVLDDPQNPYLRSENSAYPARITAKDEMQIQGVMVGKLAAAQASGAGE